MNSRGRDVVNDAIAWMLFTAVIVVIILGCAAITWIVAP